MRYDLTSQELRKSQASAYKNGDIISVGRYDIHIRYISRDGQQNYDTPSLCTFVERDWKMLDCTPGVERPYYIDDFINR